MTASQKFLKMEVERTKTACLQHTVPSPVSMSQGRENKDEDGVPLGIDIYRVDEKWS